MPDLSSFPRADWAWAVRQACAEIASADLGYGDPRGSAVLREVLAGYLRRVRAAAADPGQVVISTGFAQGVNLVLRALDRGRGVSCVAFEDPGYGSAQTDETVRAAVAIGLRAVYVPVDDGGTGGQRRWRRAAPRSSWSPRRTSRPPGWCCPRRAGTRWWTGRAARAGT